MSIDFKKIDETQVALKNPASGFLKTLLEQFNRLSTISAQEKQFFMQNLQVMIKSGLPLDRSLKTLSEQTKNKRFKSIIETLCQDTEKGVAFKDSLAKFKNVFGELTVNMVQAGEVSGRLEEVLAQIYLQIKKGNELKSRIRSAMIYPVIVIIAMIGIGIGMMIFVIPKITAMFTEIEADLPLATRILIKTSGFIVNNGLLVGLLAIIIIIALIVFIRSVKGRYFIDGCLLRTPIAGPIIQKINLAKFTRTFSSLIKTDIPIVKTFEVTAQTLGNKRYQEALSEAGKKLKKGVGIAEALKSYQHLFPPVIIQMTATGEETGRVDEILAELASFYEDEIDRIMKTLPSIIEPVLMVILGVGVALMAVAIIMPMYSLTEKF